jgi:hypothetical protein
MNEISVLPTFVDKRSIELPNGDILEVEMTQAFIARLIVQFNLNFASELTNDMIRLYVWGSLKNATDKAESEMNDV